MALGAEIATAFVRIRPLTTNFAGEALAKIKPGLVQVGDALAAQAAENVQVTLKEVEANRVLAESYQGIAAAAIKGSDEQRVAMTLAGDAAVTEATLLGNAFRGIGASAAAAGAEIQAGIAGGAAKGVAEADGFLAGLKGRLFNLGTLFGVAFGGAIIVKFAKDLVGAAATVQKSNEVITTFFGKSAAAVEQFANVSAARLGIAAKDATASAARFGILFHNLGIIPPQAAVMTVGLQKLAGSLSLVRGVDPTLALQQLDRAMLGNTRGLKQLGLAVDPASEKLEAMRLHILGVGEAMTPAIRAQAIYAIATQHLGDYLALARKHATDYASAQRILSAEWSNAKEAIGRGLTAPLADLAVKLGDWLAKMNESGRLEQDVTKFTHQLGQVFDAVRTVLSPLITSFRDLVGILGGARNAVITFFIAFAITKIYAIAGAITGALIKQGILLIGPAVQEAEGEVVVGTRTMALSFTAVGTAIKTALITTGIGALVVAVSYATFYTITHWEQVKRFTVLLAHSIQDTWRGLKDVLIGYAKVTGGAMATALLAPFLAVLEGASKVAGLLDKLTFGKLHIKEGIAGALEGVKAISVGLVKGGSEQALKGGEEIGAVFGKAWKQSIIDTAKPDPAATKAMHDAGTTLGTTLTTAASDAISQAKTAIGQAQQKLAQAVQAANASVQSAKLQVARTIHDTNQQIAQLITTGNQKVQQAAVAAATNLNSLGTKLAAVIAKFLKTGQSPADLAKSPLGQSLARLRAAIASGQGGAELVNAAQELSSQLQAKQASSTTLKDKAQQHLNDLTDELNKGEITVKQFHKRLLAYLSTLGVSYAKVGKSLGKAQADAYQAEVAAILKQAGIIAAEPAKLRHSVERHGAGLAPKVIDVQDIRAQQDRKIAQARAKAAERISAARHHEVMAEQAAHRRILAASLVEQKTIAKYAGVIATNTKKKKPTKKAADANKGTTAHDARTNALHHR